MQIQPFSRKKTLNGPRVRGISPEGKEKVYGGKNLPNDAQAEMHCHLMRPFHQTFSALITKLIMHQHTKVPNMG